MEAQERAARFLVATFLLLVSHRNSACIEQVPEGLEAAGRRAERSEEENNNSKERPPGGGHNGAGRRATSVSGEPEQSPSSLRAAMALQSNGTRPGKGQVGDGRGDTCWRPATAPERPCGGSGVSEPTVHASGQLFVAQQADRERPTCGPLRDGNMAATSRRPRAQVVARSAPLAPVSGGGEEGGEEGSRGEI